MATTNSIVYSHHGTTEVAYVLFLLLVSVIIMNLLIGLAISNITAQFQNAGVYRLKMTVELTQVLEDVVTAVRRFCLCSRFRHNKLYENLKAAADQGRMPRHLSLILSRHTTYFMLLKRE